MRPLCPAPNTYAESKSVGSVEVWIVQICWLFGVPVLIAQAEQRILSPGEMFGWAAVVSLIGGIAAAWRNGNKPGVLDLLMVGLNTAVLGGCLAMVGYRWSSESPTLSWTIIGGCGILSLGGLAVVDWALSLAKSRIKKHVDDQ